MSPELLPPAVSLFNVTRSSCLENSLRLQFQKDGAVDSDSLVSDLMRESDRGRHTISSFIGTASGDEGGVLSVQTVLILRDGAAHVYPVNFVNDDFGGADSVAREALLDQHFQLVDQTVCEVGGWIAQSLLKPGDTCAKEQFERAGYRHLTDLLFLELELENCRLELRERLPTLISAIRYSDQECKRFADLIESTYTDSLDCPELNGMRTGRHAMKSHGLSGKTGRKHWCLFSCQPDQSTGRQADRTADLGVVLVSDHVEAPDVDNDAESCIEPVCEIVYFGVSPANRNQGLGRQFLSHALREAYGRGMRIAMLGVDIRNTPAIGLYRQLGFEEFDRRSVVAKFFVT